MQQRVSGYPPSEVDQVTRRVWALLWAHDEAGASREALRVYGAEVYGFLLGALDDPSNASSLYADVQKRVETEVGGLAALCSLRTWLYLLARRELRERRLQRGQRGERTASFGRVASGERRASSSNAISTLRTSLTEEERELLILRVDRKFTWREIALTDLGERAVDPERIALATRAVRERIQAIILRVRQAAAAEMNDPPDGRP
jgi:DNA-directed RNA polymerase specialized sigma24 family protein